MGLPRPSKPGPAPPLKQRSVARYMTSFGGSPDPVCAYVNTRFLPCWGTTDFGQIADEIYRTLARGVREVSLYVDWLLWDNQQIPVRYVGSAVGKARLHELCVYLREAGVLRYVKCWWMPDEPGRDKKISERDFRQCTLDMMEVSAAYPDLTGVRFVVSYGYPSDPVLAPDLMHVLGFCKYDDPAGVLHATEGLERTMAAHQSSLIIPAMYTSERKPLVIEQYLQYMLTHPKCGMMCTFLYDALQGGYSTDAGMAARVASVFAAVTARTTGLSLPTQPPAVVPTPPALTQWPEGISPPQPYVDPPRDGGGQSG